MSQEPLSTVVAALPHDSADESATSAEWRHQRAERLLGQALACSDDHEAEALREEAVVLSLDLPEQVARRYRGRGIDHDDLVQVGRLGLVKAVHGYRAGVGSGFVAYAMPTISGEVKRHFRDCGWAVRPPRRLQEVRALLGAEEELLVQTLHRSPTPDEVADGLGLERSEVELARQCGSAYSAISLDLTDEHGGVRFDVVAPESADIDRMLRLSSLSTVLAALTDRERLIIRLSFVEDCTQAEIGKVLGVSQMQVSRLLAAILARLRVELVGSAHAA